MSRTLRLAKTSTAERQVILKDGRRRVFNGVPESLKAARYKLAPRNRPGYQKRVNFGSFMATA